MAFEAKARAVDLEVVKKFFNIPPEVLEMTSRTKSTQTMTTSCLTVGDSFVLLCLSWWMQMAQQIIMALGHSMYERTNINEWIYDVVYTTHTADDAIIIE